MCIASCPPASQRIIVGRLSVGGRPTACCQLPSAICQLAASRPRLLDAHPSPVIIKVFAFYNMTLDFLFVFNASRCPHTLRPSVSYSPTSPCHRLLFLSLPFPFLDLCPGLPDGPSSARRRTWTPNSSSTTTGKRASDKGEPQSSIAVPISIILETPRLSLWS